MAGNPNWWSIMNIPAPLPSSPPPASSSFSTSLPPLHPPVYPYPHQYVFGSFSSHPSSSFEAENHKSSPRFLQTGNWALNWPNQNNESYPRVHVKQDQSSDHGNPFIQHEELLSGHTSLATVFPSALMVPVSSPRSCVTTSSLSYSSLSELSSNIAKGEDHCSKRNQNTCRSSPKRNYCIATGGACKKARVQTSTSKQPLKVRKEKLGDRITTLHQLVSPFGKTDTASVLLETFGYIRFLHRQVEALSSPYLDNTSVASGNSNLPRTDNGWNDDMPKDLKSRGLCLVPVSCTVQIADGHKGAESWAPPDFHVDF
ncbi:hypothetical protein SAY86_026661 [Trapa natans]|uniref:BHLH domain-containing protein n=1 Tax=Trapa natans TaxID=22666 RepID=A0AAN7QER4_TRANT|nr:hypothetical protein SAY86_026661 [Trapa natans]